MISLKKTAVTVFAVVFAAVAFSACTSTPKEVSYTDKTQPAEARARDLLSKLSLEEPCPVQFPGRREARHQGV